jgi:putative FmdB family regulatory protein
MPIFEFTCESCGESFEELVRSANDTSRVICPQCSSNQVKKKISLFSAQAPGGRATSYWGNPSASSCNTGSV